MSTSAEEEKYMILESGVMGYEQLSIVLSKQEAEKYFKTSGWGFGKAYLLVKIVDSKYREPLE